MKKSIRPHFISLFFIIVNFMACYQETGNSGSNIEESGVPQNLWASQAMYSDRVILYWDTVSGAEHYNIYRSNSAYGEYTDMNFEPVYSGIYILDTSGVHYFYKITSEDSLGNESPLSSYVEGWSNPGSSDYLDTPGGFTASKGTYADYVTLSWSSVTGATYYFIYRGPATNTYYEFIGLVSYSHLSTYNSTTSPSDYPVTPGTHYYYRVTAATDQYYESSFSSFSEGYTSSK